MLEMCGKSPSTRIRHRLKELTGGEDGDGPFVAFDPKTGGKDDAEERKQQEQTRRFEYALLNSNINGRVEPADNGKNFDLQLTLELERVPSHPGLVLTIKPFNTSQSLKPHRLQPGQTETCIFTNVRYWAKS